ncbi:MAG TPA: DJ-1/PfpI family protein [Streptosporangiaceae bacterium]|nr:DJ-1/PfpI family protein [Streptosporangiaceae bacterium]
MSTVVFLLAPQLHLLDLAGPAQVFSTAADLGQDYQLRFVGEQKDVPTAQGICLQASVTWPQLSPDDFIVVPGWRSPERESHAKFSAATVERLKEHYRGGGIVASVCAGAFALGQAGLLDGRRCTTHHDLQDALASRYERATVVHDMLYVIDERLVTSAGIASGIDLVLHLLARRHGPNFAAKIARQMVVYARRNGDEHQTSAMLRFRSHISDTVHCVQDLIDARFAEQLTLGELAVAGGVSERTLTRAFGRATGLTPLRYQQLLRLERAEHLIGRGATVEAAARDVGFTDARMLRRLRSRGQGRPLPAPSR